MDEIFLTGLIDLLNTPNSRVFSADAGYNRHEEVAHAGGKPVRVECNMVSVCLEIGRPLEARGTYEIRTFKKEDMPELEEALCTLSAETYQQARINYARVIELIEQRRERIMQYHPRAPATAPAEAAFAETR